VSINVTVVVQLTHTKNNINSIHFNNNIKIKSNYNFKWHGHKQLALSNSFGHSYQRHVSLHLGMILQMGSCGHTPAIGAPICRVLRHLSWIRTASYRCFILSCGHSCSWSALSSAQSRNNRVDTPVIGMCRSCASLSASHRFRSSACSRILHHWCDPYRFFFKPFGMQSVQPKSSS